MLGVRSRMPYNGVNCACHKRGQDHHSKGHWRCKLTLPIAYSQRPSTVGQQNFIPVLPTFHPSSCSTMSTSEELGSLLATLHMTYIYIIIIIYKDIDWHIVSWNMKRDYCTIVWLLDVIVYYYFCCIISIVLVAFCSLNVWPLATRPDPHITFWALNKKSLPNSISLFTGWPEASMVHQERRARVSSFPIENRMDFCWPRIVQFFQSHWLHP